MYARPEPPIPFYDAIGRDTVEPPSRVRDVIPSAFYTLYVTEPSRRAEPRVSPSLVPLCLTGARNEEGVSKRKNLKK